MIDEDRAPGHGGEGAFRAGGDRTQVIVIADAGEHDLGALGGPGRGRGRAAAMLGDKVFGLRRGAIVHADVMPLGREMAGHRETHHAKTNEG